MCTKFFHLPWLRSLWLDWLFSTHRRKSPCQDPSGSQREAGGTFKREVLEGNWMKGLVAAVWAGLMETRDGEESPRNHCYFWSSRASGEGITAEVNKGSNCGRGPPDGSCGLWQRNIGTATPLLGGKRAKSPVSCGASHWPYSTGSQRARGLIGCNPWRSACWQRWR